MGKIRRRDQKKKGIDAIYEDLINPVRVHQLTHQEVDPEMTGEGQFYCVTCARYFVDQHTMTEHEKGKPHKFRVRQLRTKPWTLEDSRLPVDNGKKRSLLPPIINTNNINNITTTTTTTTTTIIMETTTINP